MEDYLQTRKTLPPIRTTDAPPMDLSPVKSRTDPPAPEKHHHDKSHLHKRLHSSSLRHRAFTGSKEHAHRHRAKETVQSAIELKPPISFDSLLRRDKKSPESSQQVSTQQVNQQQQHQAALAEWRAQQAQQAERRRIRPEDVRNARRENDRRGEELRTSLKDVEEIAMSSTRQLDDTYYSILEKASILRSTVVSLQQLAQESRRMHAQFKEDTSELQEETKKNLGAFGNFDGQEKTINHLVEQLRGSKERTKKLNERLEAARNRVEAFEQRETERQSSRRKRWGAAWCVVVVVLAFIIAVLTAKHRSAVGTRVHHYAKVIDEFGHEIASPIGAALRPTASPSEDPFLRTLFDEL